VSAHNIRILRSFVVIYIALEPGNHRIVTMMILLSAHIFHRVRQLAAPQRQHAVPALPGKERIERSLLVQIM
jgi:hypothetical protein